MPLAANVAMLPMSTPPQQKLCPNCRTPSPLTAPTCAQCGHVYRTQFREPGVQPRQVVPPTAPVPGDLPLGGVEAAITALVEFQEALAVCEATWEDDDVEIPDVLDQEARERFHEHMQRQAAIERNAAEAVGVAAANISTVVTAITGNPCGHGVSRNTHHALQNAQLAAKDAAGIVTRLVVPISSPMTPSPQPPIDTKPLLDSYFAAKRRYEMASQAAIRGLQQQERPGCRFW